MTLVCPHCGADLAKPGSLEVGEWLFYPDRTMVRAGTVLHLPGYLRAVLYTLFKAQPATLSTTTLARRFGVSRETIRTYMSETRRWFRERDIPYPVTTDDLGSRWAKYRWTG